MKAINRLWTLLLCVFLISSLRITRAAETAEENEESEEMGIVVGIDLGTSNSAVGVYRDGKVEIIANKQGNRITPSYVAFTESETLIGEAAKNQADSNPQNTLYAIKRLIGRRFDEKSVRTDMKHFPFKVISEKNLPFAVVKTRGERRQFSPEEVSAKILAEMKALAERYLNQSVTHAVVTVPAYFTNKQRVATKNAGSIAGLDVIRIINEPTAAAIAYGIGKNSRRSQNVLVYDLGGGTFDVSLLAIDNGVYEVKATAGDTHLGGEDFDIQLTQFLIEQFNAPLQKKIPLAKNKAAFSRLKKEAERVKLQLSTAVKVEVSLDDLAEGKHLRTTVTRTQFENLCKPLFQKTISHVQKVIKAANLAKKDVDEVVLVGGSTRIPHVRKILQAFFDGKKLHTSINPDEAIAYGAAVQAQILSGRADPTTDDMLLLDVTPLSLGIETAGGVYTQIIAENTQIPTSKAQTFTTNADDQTNVKISIYEGKARMVRFNHLLGDFDLSGIEKAPRGVPQIEVTFAIDVNGILDVTAKDKSSGKQNHIQVDDATSGMDKAEIERIREGFEKDREEDERLYNRTVAKNELDAALHRAREFRKKQEKQLEAEDLDELDSLVKEVEDWDREHAAADTEPEAFREKTKAVTELVADLEGARGEGEEDAQEEGEEEPEGDDEKSDL